MSNNVTPIRAIANDQDNPLYCLEDLRDALDLASIIEVAAQIIKNKGKILEKTAPGGGHTNLYIPRKDLNKIISSVNTPEVRALGYMIIHGIDSHTTSFGDRIYNAKDVATCLGYTNPDRAIRKYCKSAAAGYINKNDVAILCLNSRLANAPMLTNWIGRWIYRWEQLAKENNR